VGDAELLRLEVKTIRSRVAKMGVIHDVTRRSTWSTFRGRIRFSTQNAAPDVFATINPSNVFPS
jgi:hypothetical protein